VLIIDADERATPAMIAEIRQLLAEPDDAIDGYWIGRDNYFMGKRIRFCGWNSDDVFRLVRRDRCRYRQVRVHEEIDVPRSRAGRLKSKFTHYTYWTYDQFFAKHVRYTKLGADDMWEQGKRTGVYGLAIRPFLRFLLLYLFRGGIFDGLAGLQVCMLTAFFNTFVKQARLWEREFALPQPDDAGPETATGSSNSRKAA
jgi:hypothetical protein